MGGAEGGQDEYEENEDSLSSADGRGSGSESSADDVSTMLPPEEQRFLHPESPWEAWYDDDGDVYYSNEQTGETSWEYPSEGIAADNAPPAGVSWSERHS